MQKCGSKSIVFQFSIFNIKLCGNLGRTVLKRSNCPSLFEGHSLHWTKVVHLRVKAYFWKRKSSCFQMTYQQIFKSDKLLALHTNCPLQQLLLTYRRYEKGLYQFYILYTLIWYILYILNGIGKGMVQEVNKKNRISCLLLRLENMKEVCREHLKHFHNPFSFSHLSRRTGRVMWHHYHKTISFHSLTSKPTCTSMNP